MYCIGRFLMFASDLERALTRTLDPVGRYQPIRALSRCTHVISRPPRLGAIGTASGYTIWLTYRFKHLEHHRFKVLGLSQLEFVLSSSCMVKYANQLTLEKPTATYRS
jgi:hypothetical protein